MKYSLININVIFVIYFFNFFVEIKEKTKDMIYISEGSFMMGCNQQNCAGDDSEHTVFLDSFWIDKTEVTVGDYSECVREKYCKEPVSSKIYDKDIKAYNWFMKNRWNYPMNYVTWYQAKEFCEWKGKRLPTEAEWEKSARGTDGRVFPWGNEEPNCSLAIMLQLDHSFSGCNIDQSWPVGSVKGSSPYGVLDLSGNVSEWVSDHYEGDYYLSSPLKNPSGPKDKIDESYRIVRGGSYASSAEEGFGLRVYERSYEFPDKASPMIGFRCVLDVPRID